MRKLNILRSLAGFALCVISVSGCEGLLDEHPKKIDATTAVYDAESAEAVINSIYYQLHRQPAFGRYLSVLPEALADYAYGRGNYNTSYETGLTSGAITFSEDSWAVLYRAIRFANEILVEMPNATMSASDLSRLTAETRFLRAFSYSYLVKYYGAVPFFNEDNMDDFNKVRTSEDEMWEWIVDEAAYAAENLPAVASEAGRPTKYAASMLKAEAEMYLERWADAATSLETIISSRKYSLIELSTSDDFEKLYGSTVNNTSEEIFYIKYNQDVTATFEWMFLCKPNPVYPTGALGIYTDYVKNNFISSWDTNDFRYQWSLYKQTENGTLNGITKTGMICLKYRDYNNGTSAANDWPVYRYADVLLYYAEALCHRDGKPSAEAMEYLNMTRRRAYGLDPTQSQGIDYNISEYSTEDAFMELLLKERGYETIFEGKRYCDLKRCGKLASAAVAAGKIASEGAVGVAAYWWPIPTSEFNYNTSLDPEKDQNPGY